jgi:hypothetical protein
VTRTEDLLASPESTDGGGIAIVPRLPRVVTLLKQVGSGSPIPAHAVTAALKTLTLGRR